MDPQLQVADTLARAIKHLLDSRSPQGHWNDVRSTALATWALCDVLAFEPAPQAAPSEIRAALSIAQSWLGAQAKRDEGGISWESEAWDTALAVIALSPDEAFAERLDQATAWLQRIRGPVTGAWCDEVWETTLSTVALLRAEQLRKGPRDHLPWIEGVLTWLVQIPSKSSGEFICPHYSGFLGWLLGELLRSHVARSLSSTAAFTEFQEKANQATRWLIDNISSEPGRLWSEYTFANAYIGYGLSMLSRLQQLDASYALVLARWLRERQGEGGGFEDTEDTAIAILALSSLLQHAPHEIQPLFEQLRRLLPQTTITVAKSKAAAKSKMGAKSKTTAKCFLGFSGASKGVAAQIEVHLKHTLPNVSFGNWIWDFQEGQTLIDEIDIASRECCAAIFLVTKDDTLAANDGMKPVPRDNIIFEVGFFAARLGMKNTFLVVEDGTKVPKDLGGVIYIQMTDRHNLDSVFLRLGKALTRILSAD